MLRTTDATQCNRKPIQIEQVRHASPSLKTRYTVRSVLQVHHTREPVQSELSRTFRAEDVLTHAPQQHEVTKVLVKQGSSDVARKAHKAPPCEGRLVFGKVPDALSCP